MSNIYKKMSDITNELGFVNKNMQIQVNKTASYKAVSEVDILEAVKPLEAKHGVFSYPVETNIVQQDLVTTTTQYGDRTNYFIRLERVYRFVNIDDPTDFIEVKSYGDGLDTGDKATGKAMTYADKYALMKAYKISTGDDPDKNASEEGTTKKQPKKEPLKATEEQITELRTFYGERIVGMLAHYKIDNIKELPKAEATKLINIARKEQPKIDDL